MKELLHCYMELRLRAVNVADANMGRVEIKMHLLHGRFTLLSLFRRHICQQQDVGDGGNSHSHTTDFEQHGLETIVWKTPGG